MGVDGVKEELLILAVESEGTAEELLCVELMTGISVFPCLTYLC